MTRAPALTVLLLSIAAVAGCAHHCCDPCEAPWCGSGMGCGETFWGDWFGGGCEPCDMCGNWTGPLERYDYAPELISHRAASTGQEPTPADEGDEADETDSDGSDEVLDLHGESFE